MIPGIPRDEAQSQQDDVLGVAQTRVRVSQHGCPMVMIKRDRPPDSGHWMSEMYGFSWPMQSKERYMFKNMSR